MEFGNVLMYNQTVQPKLSKMTEEGLRCSCVFVLMTWE